MEDAILSCCTVKLVIQPLLENAIYYGMESMDGDGEITVVGYRKGDDVYVEVRDNGLGMPDEMVDALLTENNRVRKHGSVWDSSMYITGSDSASGSRMVLRLIAVWMRGRPCGFTFRTLRTHRKIRNCWREED